MATQVEYVLRQRYLNNPKESLQDLEKKRPITKAPFPMNADQLNQFEQVLHKEHLRVQLQVKYKRKELENAINSFNVKNTRQVDMQVMKEIESKMESSSQTIAKLMFKHMDSNDNQFIFGKPAHRPLTPTEEEDYDTFTDAWADMFACHHNAQMVTLGADKKRTLEYMNTSGRTEKTWSIDDVLGMTFLNIYQDALRSDYEAIENEELKGDTVIEFDERDDLLDLDDDDTTTFIGARFKERARKTTKRQVKCRPDFPQNPQGTNELDAYFIKNNDKMINVWHEITDPKNNGMKPLPEFEVIWRDHVRPMLLGFLKRCHSKYDPKKDKNPNDLFGKYLAELDKPMQEQSTTMLIGPRTEGVEETKVVEKPRLGWKTMISVSQTITTFVLGFGIAYTLVSVVHNAMHGSAGIKDLNDQLDEAKYLVKSANTTFTEFQAKNEEFNAVFANLTKLTRDQNIKNLNIVLQTPEVINYIDTSKRLYDIGADFDVYQIERDAINAASNLTLHGKKIQELENKFRDTFLGNIQEGNNVLVNTFTSLGNITFHKEFTNLYGKEALLNLKPLDIEKFRLAFFNESRNIKYNVMSWLNVNATTNGIYAAQSSNVMKNLNSIFSDPILIENKQLRGNVDTITNAISILTQNLDRQNELLSTIAKNKADLERILDVTNTTTITEMIDNIPPTQYFSSKAFEKLAKANMDNTTSEYTKEAVASVARAFGHTAASETHLSLFDTIYFTTQALFASAKNVAITGSGWGLLASTLALAYFNNTLGTCYALGIFGSSILWFGKQFVKKLSLMGGWKSKKEKNDYEKKMESFDKNEQEALEKLETEFHTNMDKVEAATRANANTIEGVSDYRRNFRKQMSEDALNVEIEKFIQTLIVQNKKTIELEYNTSKIIIKNKYADYRNKTTDEVFKSEESHQCANAIIKKLEKIQGPFTRAMELALKASHLFSVINLAGSAWTVLSVHGFYAALLSIIWHLIVLAFPFLVITLGLLSIAYVVDKITQTNKATQITAYFLNVDANASVFNQIVSSWPITFMHPRYYPWNFYGSRILGTLMFNSLPKVALAIPDLVNTFNTAGLKGVANPTGGAYFKRVDTSFFQTEFNNTWHTMGDIMDTSNKNPYLILNQAVPKYFDPQSVKESITNLTGIFTYVDTLAAADKPLQTIQTMANMTNPLNAVNITELSNHVSFVAKWIPAWTWKS